MLLDCKKAGFKEGRCAAPSFAFLQKRLGWAVVVSAVCLAFFTGCEKNAKVNSNFVDAFVELRIVDIAYGNDSPTARLVRQETLKKCGYTREQFLAETEKLLNDEKRWVAFQQAVVNRIDSLMKTPASEARSKLAPTEKSKPVSAMPAHKGGVH